MRFQFIDGLRGSAMLMVLFYHGWLCTGSWHTFLPPPFSRVDLAFPLSFGHIGVNLFLVLSGFCLYWPFVRTTVLNTVFNADRSVLKSNGEPTLRQFAVKRVRRIVPPYLFALLMTLGIVFLQSECTGSHFDPRYWSIWLFMHICMMHNLRPAFVLAGNGSLWSLALEWQLYVAFPILVECYRRLNGRVVVLAVLAVSVVYRGFIARGGLTPDEEFGYVLAYSVFGRCFEFAVGMYAAMVTARIHRKEKLSTPILDTLPLLFILPAAVIDGRNHGHYQTLTDIMWGLLFAYLLTLSARREGFLNKILSSRWIVALGTFSYSVYLIHLPIMMWVGDWMETNPFFVRHGYTSRVSFEFLCVIPLVVAFAYLFHLAFERPFMTKTPGRVAEVRSPQ